MQIKKFCGIIAKNCIFIYNRKMDCMSCKVKYQTETKYCYDKTYVKQLFSESEMGRLLNRYQAQLKMKKVKVIIYPDFAVEYCAKQLNRAIDETQKKAVSQIMLDNDCKYDTFWHGSTQLFAMLPIIKDLGGNINKLVDKKKRTQNVKYINNMINGLYKNAKFSAEEESETDLQLFAGF